MFNVCPAGSLSGSSWPSVVCLQPQPYEPQAQVCADLKKFMQFRDRLSTERKICCCRQSDCRTAADLSCSAAQMPGELGNATTCSPALSWAKLLKIAGAANGSVGCKLFEGICLPGASVGIFCCTLLMRHQCDLCVLISYLNVCRSAAAVWKALKLIDKRAAFSAVDWKSLSVAGDAMPEHDVMPDSNGSLNMTAGLTAHGTKV